MGACLCQEQRQQSQQQRRERHRCTTLSGSSGGGAEHGSSSSSSSSSGGDRRLRSSDHGVHSRRAHLDGDDGVLAAQVLVEGGHLQSRGGGGATAANQPVNQSNSQSNKQTNKRSFSEAVTAVAPGCTTADQRRGAGQRAWGGTVSRGQLHLGTCTTGLPER